LAAAAALAGFTSEEDQAGWQRWQVHADRVPTWPQRGFNALSAKQRQRRAVERDLDPIHLPLDLDGEGQRSAQRRVWKRFHGEQLEGSPA
jgi:hypothetical protein